MYQVVWDGDLSYQQNTNSKTEASKRGAELVTLEVEWVATGTKPLPK
ncbi:MAG: hypothetical protein ACPHL6_02220 [Rubripirellula sp.]